MPIPYRTKFRRTKIRHQVEISAVLSDGIFFIGFLFPHASGKVQNNFFRRFTLGGKLHLFWSHISSIYAQVVVVAKLTKYLIETQ